MKQLFISLLLFLATTPLWAQSDPEYKMEIGAGVGVMGYLGDFNESLLKDLQPMGTLLARYNLSPYMGVKMNVSFGKMKGSSADVKLTIPVLPQPPIPSTTHWLMWTLHTNITSCHTVRVVIIVVHSVCRLMHDRIGCHLR